MTLDLDAAIRLVAISIAGAVVATPLVFSLVGIVLGVFGKGAEPGGLGVSRHSQVAPRATQLPDRNAGTTASPRGTRWPWPLSHGRT